MSAAAARLVGGMCQRHGPFEGDCGGCRRQARIAELEAAREASERAQRTRELLARADLPVGFLSCSLDGYAPRTELQRKALEVCERYVDELEARVARRRGLMLLGPTGVGKTHLLVAIAAEAIVRGISARYVAAEGLVAAWGIDGVDRRGGDGTWVNVRPAFVMPKLLVVDDIYVFERSKETSALFALIDERYRRGVPTLVASNLRFDLLKAEIGERTVDRLIDGSEIVPVDGQSARKPA